MYGLEKVVKIGRVGNKTLNIGSIKKFTNYKKAYYYIKYC